MGQVRHARRYVGVVVVAGAALAVFMAIGERQTEQGVGSSASVLPRAPAPSPLPETTRGATGFSETFDKGTSAGGSSSRSWSSKHCKWAKQWDYTPTPGPAPDFTATDVPVPLPETWFGAEVHTSYALDAARKGPLRQYEILDGTRVFASYDVDARVPGSSANLTGLVRLLAVSLEAISDLRRNTTLAGSAPFEYQFTTKRVTMLGQEYDFVVPSMVVFGKYVTARERLRVATSLMWVGWNLHMDGYASGWAKGTANAGAWPAPAPAAPLTLQLSKAPDARGCSVTSGMRVVAHLTGWAGYKYSFDNSSWAYFDRTDVNDSWPEDTSSMYLCPGTMMTSPCPTPMCTYEFVFETHKMGYAKICDQSFDIALGARCANASHGPILSGHVITDRPINVNQPWFIRGMQTLTASETMRIYMELVLRVTAMIVAQIEGGPIVDLLIAEAMNQLREYLMNLPTGYKELIREGVSLMVAPEHMVAFQRSGS